MKRTLIIYGTRKGTTEMTARVIAEILILKHGHDVELTSIGRIRRYRRHLDEFNNLVVGTSIISGRWVRRVLRFLKRHTFDNQQVALFVTAGNTLNKAVKNEIPKHEAVQEAIQNYIDMHLNEFMFEPVSKMAFGGILKRGEKKFNSWNREDIEAWAVHLGNILN